MSSSVSKRWHNGVAWYDLGGNIEPWYSYLSTVGRYKPPTRDRQLLTSYRRSTRTFIRKFGCLRFTYTKSYMLGRLGKLFGGV